MNSKRGQTVYMCAVSVIFQGDISEQHPEGSEIQQHPMERPT